MQKATAWQCGVQLSCALKASGLDLGLLRGLQLCWLIRRRGVGFACSNENAGAQCKPSGVKLVIFKWFLRDCKLDKKSVLLLVWCLLLLSWLQERYRKALADSENVRRRTQKFVEDAKLFGKQSEEELCLLQRHACLPEHKTLLSSFSLPSQSCPCKGRMMFGLDCWCLSLLTIFLYVQLRRVKGEKTFNHCTLPAPFLRMRSHYFL